jgi:hypothetical protein
VGDDQGADPQRGDQAQNCALDYRVQTGRGLVGDQQIRLSSERERNRDALALAA